MNFDKYTIKKIHKMISEGTVTNKEVIKFYNNEWWDDTNEQKYNKMKKLIISVGALGVMSFTGNQLMNTYQIASAIDNVQDLQEWMKEDVVSGYLQLNIANDYLEILGETEWRLIEFAESNRLTQPTGDYQVNENGNMIIK